MYPNRKLNADGPRSARQRWATLLFIVLLTVAMYLLGTSMNRHHFFGGSRDYQMMKSVPTQ
jgi:hypothetical protein